MRWKRTVAADPKHRESAMTPMIDVVFQLLAFFILTFRVVSPEGDFAVTMPSAAPEVGAEPPLEETLHVRLAADADGKLADIAVNRRSLGPDISALHRYVLDAVGVAGPSALRLDVDAELEFDPGLRYEHAMAALTAISAYRDATGNSAVLIERVKFAPPRARS